MKRRAFSMTLHHTTQICCSFSTAHLVMMKAFTLKMTNFRKTRRIHEEEPDDEFLIDSCEDLEQNPNSLSLCNCVAVPSHEPIGVPGLRGRPYRNRRITGLALTSHLLSTPTSKLRHSDVVMGGLDGFISKIAIVPLYLDGFISKIAIVPLYLKMRNMMKTREMA